MDTINERHQGMQCVQRKSEQSIWVSIFNSLQIVKETLRGLQNGQSGNADDAILRHAAFTNEGLGGVTEPSEAVEVEVRKDRMRLERERHDTEQECSSRKDEITSLSASLARMTASLESTKNEMTTRIVQGEQKITMLEAETSENSQRLDLKDQDVIRLAKFSEDAAETVIQLNEQLQMERAVRIQFETDGQQVMAKVDTLEAAVQCQRDRDLLTRQLAQTKKEWSDKLKMECEYRDRDHRRLMAAKEKEIRMLKSLADTNVELVNLVAHLRQQLEMRHGGENLTANGMLNDEKNLRKMFPSSSRALSVSQSSNLNSLESEPEAELETTGIMSSISRHSSISRGGSFKYKDLTPNRLAELQRRNSVQLPHLKSSYPVEQSARAWRHDSPEQVTTSSNIELASCGVDQVKKDGFLKKFSSTLRSVKKAGKPGKDRDKENTENRPVEKPVAFVVEIAPGKKRAQKPKLKR